MGEILPHTGGAGAPQTNGGTRPAVSACLTVRADVTVEEVLGYFRTQGGLPNDHVLFVLDHDHDFVGTLPVTYLASAQPSMLVRDLMRARRRHPQGHLFEPGGEQSDNRSLIKKAAPSMGLIWLAFILAAFILALLVFMLVTLAKV